LHEKERNDTKMARIMEINLELTETEIRFVSRWISEELFNPLQE